MRTEAGNGTVKENTGTRQRSLVTETGGINATHFIDLLPY
jgi:hypothetical protein